MNNLVNIYNTLLQISEGVKIKSEVSFSLQPGSDTQRPLLQIRVIARIKGSDRDLYFQRLYSEQDIKQDVEQAKVDLVTYFIDEVNAQLKTLSQYDNLKSLLRTNRLQFPVIS